MVKGKDRTLPIMVPSTLPCYLIPLKPNYFLTTLFPQTLRLCLSISMTDKLHDQNNAGNIIVLYTLILMFLDGKQEYKKFLLRIAADIF